MRVPAGAGYVRIGDELTVDAYPPGGQVLLDPLVGQPCRGEPVAHRRRGSGVVVGHADIMIPSTDNSRRTSAARHGDIPAHLPAEERVMVWAE